MTEQHEPGWACPECGMVRGEDQHDPCLGKLPGVLFACCGHGGKVPGHRDGYIYFENGKIIRFAKLTELEQIPADDIWHAQNLKERLGQ